MTTPRSSRRRVESRRAEICRTAARIFRARGFDATSVSDVARALKMTKAGLYYYFPSKEALLFEILTFGLERVRDEVIEPAREIADPEERLREIVIRHARIVTRAQGAVAQLSIDETRALPPAARRTLAKQRRVYFDLVRGTLDELQAAGRLRDVDTTVAAFSVIGMVLWLPRWLHHGGRLTAEEAANELADLAMAAVLQPGATSKSPRAPRRRAPARRARR